MRLSWATVKQLFPGGQGHEQTVRLFQTNAPLPHMQVRTMALKTSPLLIFRVFTATFHSLFFVLFWSAQMSPFLLLTQPGLSNGGTGDNGVIQKGESEWRRAWADR